MDMATRSAVIEESLENNGAFRYHGDLLYRLLFNERYFQ